MLPIGLLSEWVSLQFVESLDHEVNIGKVGEKLIGRVFEDLVV